MSHLPADVHKRLDDKPAAPAAVLLDKREPMRRRTTSDRESNAMNLPEGKTCADCMHCRRCCLMFGHIPADEVCDWYPSRFQAKEKP